MDLEGNTIKGDYKVSNFYDYRAVLGSSYLDASGNFHFSYTGTKWEDYVADHWTDKNEIFYHRVSTDFLWFDDINSQYIGPGDNDDRVASYAITVSDYRPGETWYLEGELDPHRREANSNGTIEMAPPGGDYVTIGRWESEDLRNTYHNLKRFDVTDHITGPGEYRVRWISDGEDEDTEHWIYVTTSQLYTDATLVPRTQVSFSPELNSLSPAVAADENGNAYVFWEEFKTESYDFDVDIHMSVLDPEGAILVNTTRISMSDKRAWEPQAIYNDDEIRVIWVDYRYKYQNYYYINTINATTFETSGESILLPWPNGASVPMGAITTKGDMIVIYTNDKDIAMQTQDVPPLTQGDNPANMAKGAVLMAAAVAFMVYFKPYRLWKKVFASG